MKTFTVKDARHIEDCLLLSTVARRVAGDGDDLTRVRRVFDWLVRQVQLVPAGSLAMPGGSQAQARPYDVLMRGMATEQGGWAERSWLFMSLCRQLGLDAGLVVYDPPPGKKGEPEAEEEATAKAEGQEASSPMYSSGSAPFWSTASLTCSIAGLACPSRGRAAREWRPCSRRPATPRSWRN